MKSLSYSGTVAGWKKYGRKELLRAAFMGQSISRHSAGIQSALDKAAGQDRISRMLGTRIGGIA